MLKSIVVVTILVLNLHTSEQAYVKHLDYKVVERGQLSDKLARSWGAPKAASKPFTLLQAKSNKPIYLRFIQSENAKNYLPMKQEGWNATEILVQNPDELARRLANSPFTVVGQPKFLTDKKNVRAFQALGPDNELLYFTRIIDPAKSSFDLGQASTFVDSVFIMVAGASDLTALELFYRENLHMPVSGPFPYRIGVLSNAYGMPEQTMHSLSLATLQGQFLLELDQYPPSAKALDNFMTELPPGVSMVSFTVDNIDQLSLPFFSRPEKRDTAPYYGRRSAAAFGPVNERLEFIENSILPTEGQPK